MLVASTTALAHKMEIVAKIPAENPGIVRVIVGYDTDEPTEKATVTVLDVAGKVVAEGLTDATGLWTFPRPPTGSYTIRADDGAGHRTEVVLPIPESESELAEVQTEKRNRFLMACAGVVAIAVIFFVFGWLVKIRRRNRDPG